MLQKYCLHMQLKIWVRNTHINVCIHIILIPKDLLFTSTAIKKNLQIFIFHIAHTHTHTIYSTLPCRPCKSLLGMWRTHRLWTCYPGLPPVRNLRTKAFALCADQDRMADGWCLGRWRWCCWKMYLGMVGMDSKHQKHRGNCFLKFPSSEV